MQIVEGVQSFRGAMHTLMERVKVTRTNLIKVDESRCDVGLDNAQTIAARRAVSKAHVAPDNSARSASLVTFATAAGEVILSFYVLPADFPGATTEGLAHLCASADGVCVVRREHAAEQVPAA
jgi:hypothetical protein